jgi:hypothetical protein
MENQHVFSWENPLFRLGHLAIFNSKLLVYQRDPEGKVPPEPYKETMKHMKKVMKNNDN